MLQHIKQRMPRPGLVFGGTFRRIRAKIERGPSSELNISENRYVAKAEIKNMSQFIYLMWQPRALFTK